MGKASTVFIPRRLLIMILIHMQRELWFLIKGIKEKNLGEVRKGWWTILGVSDRNKKQKIPVIRDWDFKGPFNAMKEQNGYICL